MYISNSLPFNTDLSDWITSWVVSVFIYSQSSSSSLLLPVFTFIRLLHPKLLAICTTYAGCMFNISDKSFGVISSHSALNCIISALNASLSCITSICHFSLGPLCAFTQLMSPYLSIMHAFLYSFVLHPHDLVLPFTRLTVNTFILFPQSHLHRLTIFPRCFSTTSAPNLFPSKWYFILCTGAPQFVDIPVLNVYPCTFLMFPQLHWHSQ